MPHGRFRTPDEVLRAVRNGFVSLASAWADYGVVVDAAAWAVDAATTERLRVELRAARGAAPTEARLQRDDAPPG